MSCMILNFSFFNYINYKINYSIMWWQKFVAFQNLCPTKPKITIKILIIDFLIYQYCWDGTVQIISKEICSIPRFNETNISPWVALQLDQILIHPLHISFQIINTSKYIHTENTLRWTAKHILGKFRFFVYIKMYSYFEEM